MSHKILRELALKVNARIVRPIGEGEVAQGFSFDFMQ